MAVGASSSALSYEEARRQRVEENKRRMEELGLMDLSKSLKAVKSSTPPRKPMRRKISMEELGMGARRSSRNSGKPAVSYRDQLDMLPGTRTRCGTRDRQPLPRRYLSDAARMAAVDAAEEFYKNMKNPCFVKPMLHSHTASGFWLGLPSMFSKEFLPTRDERIMLQDEKDLEWECVYLANKVGLSGGWRGFSLDHELVDGDCCIFELVEPRRFKVYIFRCEEQFEGGEEVDEKERGGEVSDKEPATEKKVTKKSNKKKAPPSAPADLAKPRKLSVSSAKKLDLKDEEEEEGKGENDSQKMSRIVKIEQDPDMAGPSRSSKRRRVNEENDECGVSAATKGNGQEVRTSKRKGKEPEEDHVIEQDSDEADEDDEGDVWKPAAQSKANQTCSGSRTSGRITRNSIARSLPPWSGRISR